MNAPTVIARAEVALTPAMLAEAFWKLSSTEQVAFFDALADNVRATYEDPSNKWRGMCGPEGDGQWYWLAKDLEEHDRARSMLMAMAAPLYMHTLRACGERL